MNKKTIIFVLILIILALSACLFKSDIFHSVNQSNQDQSSKLQVAASFYPLYYFAGAIGGDKAEVYDITPAGAEPHDYEPTPLDVVRIENSRLLILSGGGLEAWSDSVKQNLEPNRTAVITVGEGLATQMLFENGKNDIDPHIWLSPALAEEMVDKIAAGFENTDPENARYYRQNADALKARLEKLNDEYKLGLADCARRDIVTSHAAFGYLAAAYHLTQVPIAGLSPDAEPSPQQLAQIVQFAKSNNVKYIFFESLASPKLSETIAGEVGAQTLVLSPIEGLSGDEISQGKNYFTEMESNLDNLRTALECK